MKLFFLFCATVIVVLFSSKTGTAKPHIQSKLNLSGEWHWGTKGADFDLTIIQKNDTINGSYCAVALNGHRIDCADSDTDNYCRITGILHGNSAIIIFNSAYDDTDLKDTATITYNTKTKTLLWVWVQKNIVAYAPHNAILYKR